MAAVKRKRVASPAIIARTEVAVYAGAAAPAVSAAPLVTESEIVAKIGELSKTFEAFKAANDDQLKALAKGIDDVVTREKVDRINATVTALETEVSTFNKVLASFKTAGNDNTASSPERREYRGAMNKYLRKGADAGLRDLEVKAALRTDSDVDGGYTVPEELDRTINRIVGAEVVMRSIANITTIGGPIFTRLHNVGGATSGWVTETGARTETNTPTLKRMEFPAHELYANPAATQTMLDDSFLNVEAWLADEIRVAFAEKEGAAFVSGDGVSKPKGFLAYSTLADASWAWDYLGFVVTGAAADFNTAGGTPADALIDAVYALKQPYHAGASWLMNRTVMASVRKFKDVNKQYLWQPGVTAGMPSQLLGFPVNTDDNMPNVGSGAFPVAFGNWQRGYRIVDRVGIRVLRDAYTNKPYVQFYTTKRVGGGVDDFQAIKLVKCST